jgi:hypothetical protein
MSEKVIDKIFAFLEEDRKSKECDMNKRVSLGKNRSKITVNPTVKESFDVKALSPSQRARAVNYPEGVIADPNASPELKNFAHGVLQLRLGNT